MEAPLSTVDGHHRATHRTTRIDLWYPGRMYVSGRVDIFDMVDIDLFIVVALNMMVLKLGYTGESEHMFYNYLRPLTSLDEGLYALACEEDVRCLATLVRSFKATLEDITDESAGSIAANKTEKMLLLTWHESNETTKELVCDFVTPSSLPQQDSSTPCKDSVCESITPRCMPDCILTSPADEFVITYTQLSDVHGFDTQSHVLPTIQSRIRWRGRLCDITGSGVDSSGLSHDESFGVDDLDLNLNEPVNLNVSQVETQSELSVTEDSDVGHTQEPILAEVSTQEPIVAEVITQELIVAEVSTEAPIVEEVGTQEFSVEDVVIEDYVSSREDAEQGNGQEDESAPTDGQFFYDDERIDTAYETGYDVQSSEDAEPDVDVHLFGISMDLPFDNIGITNLVPDDVLEGEDVDVINVDGFDSNHGNDEEINYRKRRLAELRTEMEGVINASGQWKYSFYTGHKFTTPKEAKNRVYLHSIESIRNLKLYKNDSVRIRARREGKVLAFTMSQGTGSTSPNCGMEAGPSGSCGPTTRSKKRKNTVKTVQDQLQRELDVQIFMSKAFRAKAKAEREIRGDHVLQYSMLIDYLVELQSTNPNTTIKIAVERNTDPSLPTRVFQRIYVCLGALKLDFRACKRNLLGLDGAFMKGPFPGQVLVAVGLDSNNEIYPLAYALVEAETKSSWCWFLQCLGDDIDLHPNSNFTFISDRQKGIIPAIKTVYPSAKHRYCLRHIHENMKQRWCGQAYKDLLWRVASATNVRDFKKCMLELKTMNPKAHEWLNKIPTEHWARSHFSGRAKSNLLLNNICEVFNGKIVRGRDKPVITLLEYIMEYCMKRIMNVQGVIDKCTIPLTPTATKIMESIKKEAHLMKVQWNGANKKWELTGISYKHVVAACWNMVLNNQAAPPSETWVDRPKKKRKRSKHEDEPFVKDGKLSRKRRTITCQSCGNTRHNKATRKGQGGNNAEGSGLSDAASEGGVGDPGGAGVASQGSSYTRWTRRRVQIEIISPQKRTPTQPASQPYTNSEVPVSQTRYTDGREMGDGVPT
ncbi:heat stress transcription factor B-4-like protein [Tanacetum coccineum]